MAPQFAKEMVIAGERRARLLVFTETMFGTPEIPMLTMSQSSSSRIMNSSPALDRDFSAGLALLKWHAVAAAVAAMLPAITMSYWPGIEKHRDWDLTAAFQYGLWPGLEVVLLWGVFRLTAGSHRLSLLLRAALGVRVAVFLLSYISALEGYLDYFPASTALAVAVLFYSELRLREVGHSGLKVRAWGTAILLVLMWPVGFFLPLLRDSHPAPFVVAVGLTTAATLSQIAFFFAAHSIARSAQAAPLQA